MFSPCQPHQLLLLLHPKGPFAGVLHDPAPCMASALAWIASALREPLVHSTELQLQLPRKERMNCTKVQTKGAKQKEMPQTFQLELNVSGVLVCKW